jgi:hypothetical protein
VSDARSSASTILPMRDEDFNTILGDLLESPHSLLHSVNAHRQLLVVYSRAGRPPAAMVRSSLTSSSFITEPMQCLLQYLLLLIGTVLYKADAAHPDHGNLVRTKVVLEEVAYTVNKGQRRYEPVKEVLSARAPPAELSPTNKRRSHWKGGEKPGVGVGVPVGAAQLACIRAPFCLHASAAASYIEECVVDESVREQLDALAFGGACLDRRAAGGRGRAFRMGAR